MMLVGLCTAVAAGCYLFRRAIKPPPEATVIANFTQHRTEYEQLRSMLLSDDKLRRVADWGVETIDSPIAEVPPKGTFPADRFRE
jgi:hypothetical protein